MELEGNIHWYDIAIALLALSGAIVQFCGARLDKKPCRTIKISYGITLTIIFFYTVIFKIVTEYHGAYPYALLLILLNVLLGSSIRLWELKNTKRRMCHDCH